MVDRSARSKHHMPQLSPATTAGLARKPRHQLHMRRVAELVDGRYGLEPVATIDQQAGVASEGGGVAGDSDDNRNLACSEFLGLRLRALARRVEHHAIELAQLLRQQGAAEQVARL